MTESTLPITKIPYPLVEEEPIQFQPRAILPKTDLLEEQLREWVECSQSLSLGTKETVPTIASREFLQAITMGTRNSSLESLSLPM